MGKSHYVSFVVILLILAVAVLGYTGLLTKMTGFATSSTTALNITVGNSAPTITWVQTISAQDPTNDATTAITFNFTATDTDGESNLNDATAAAYFQKNGETTRSNTSCVTAGTGSGNNQNYTCTINMYYYDANGAWTINATIQDNNAAYGENSSTTFTYNVLTAMKMSPTSLGWPEIGVTSTNTGSSNDPIVVNNTGNDQPLNINVTGYNLRGETTTTQYIYAANLSVDNATAGCSGIAMLNATSLNITSAILQKGNHSLDYNNATSGQEQLYFCVTAINPDLSAQSYSSSAYGAWTVEIIT